MRIEGSPFDGWFTSFGGQSCDSIAGILSSGTRHERKMNRGDRQVLKWNRQPLATEEDAKAAGVFKEQSIQLYRDALGEEFVVPTEVVVGQKQDHNGMKHKVFQLQPFIEGISAKDAPLDVREDPEIVEQWEELSQRLYQLYTVASEVNSTVPEDERFPIAMTIGSSRQNSLYLEQSERLPKTKNILIASADTTLKLFDFGEYVHWNEAMYPAWSEILEVSRIPRSATIFASKNHVADQKGVSLPDSSGV